MPREAMFEFKDAFVAFLRENGVPKGASNYVVWMNRAAKRLGRSIGPAELSSDGDVETLIAELLEVSKRNKDFNFSMGSKEESDQRSTFRKYVQMVQFNFRELFEKSSETISAVRFRQAFDRFQRIHEAECGWPVKSFSSRDSFAFQWEGYKQAIPERAAAELNASRWSLEEIGNGEIIRRVIAAIELSGNNLLQWEGRQGPSSRVHARLYELQTDRKGRRELEALFYDLYKRGRANSDTFDGITRLCGKRYELLGYLFFIAKPDEFLPLRTRSFDKAFAELGVDLKTEGRCGWENYQSFIRTIRQVQTRLHAEGITDASLLDAHSFCWILARKELEQNVTEGTTRMRNFSGTLKQAATGKEFSTNDDAVIRDMQKMAVLCQASGQVAEEVAMTAERERLRREGRSDLANKVEKLSDRPGLGYDIWSHDADGSERYIEVKNVSNGKRFFLSDGEWKNSRARGNYWFYLVSVNKLPDAEVIMLQADRLQASHLRPVNYLVSYE